MKKLMEQISLMELINGLITEGKEVKSSSNQGNKNNNNNNKNNYNNINNNNNQGQAPNGEPPICSNQ
jgi:hypothetical protein